MAIAKGHVIYRARLDANRAVAITSHTVKSAGQVYATVEPRIGYSSRISVAAAERSATNPTEAVEMLLRSLEVEKETFERRLESVASNIRIVTATLNESLVR